MISSPEHTANDTSGIPAQMRHIVDAGSSQKWHRHGENLDDDSESQERASITGKVLCQILWQQPDCNFRAGKATRQSAHLHIHDV